MALNGRNYMQLATLIPGSPLLNDNALDIMTGLGIGTSINGGRGNSSLLTVDGGFNMDSGSNNYFNNARGVERSPLKYNDFGWSLGGPIQKNKLFFFAGQEWKLIRRQSTPNL